MLTAEEARSARKPSQYELKMEKFANEAMLILDKVIKLEAVHNSYYSVDPVIFAKILNCDVKEIGNDIPSITLLRGFIPLMYKIKPELEKLGYMVEVDYEHPYLWDINW